MNVYNKTKNKELVITSGERDWGEGQNRNVELRDITYYV